MSTQLGGVPFVLTSSIDDKGLDALLDIWCVPASFDMTHGPDRRDVRQSDLLEQTS